MASQDFLKVATTWSGCRLTCGGVWLGCDTDTIPILGPSRVSQGRQSRTAETNKLTMKFYFLLRLYVWWRMVQDSSLIVTQGLDDKAATISTMLVNMPERRHFWEVSWGQGNALTRKTHASLWFTAHWPEQVTCSLQSPVGQEVYLPPPPALSGLSTSVPMPNRSCSPDLSLCL